MTATDPAGTLWSDVSYKEWDFTKDGVPELVIGFRSTGTDGALAYDIVAYDPGGALRVAGHSGPLPRGVVTFEGHQVDEYAALEAPGSYRHRTIRYVVVRRSYMYTLDETVDATAVPPTSTL